MNLAGRKAVVTGGGRGIGAAVARALAAEGAAVLVAARSTAEVEGVAAELRAAGHEAWAESCDVTDPAAVAGLARAAGERMGAVDILVNNAGIANSAPLKAITLELWNRTFAVNATGTFLCTQAFTPGMVQRGWGRVVNVASIAGRTGAAYIATYAASKHAVLGFTRSVAAELAPSGVTVNAVCPGYVDTDMTRGSVERIVEKTGRPAEKVLEAIRHTSPQNRLLDAAEVAYLVVCLCDPRAGGINGQAIVQDGGSLLA
ncbi:MAG TPA: SDR family NAD(P)-dependent oxidoreductase [Thermoanaerobaculia bacterium]|nr:SDR family NAD(P)-dependent oxidoreductase [Thermoanaerobaculia bacterium]